jgi:hypothetical protein
MQQLQSTGVASINVGFPVYLQQSKSVEEGRLLGGKQSDITDRPGYGRVNSPSGAGIKSIASVLT